MVITVKIFRKLPWRPTLYKCYFLYQCAVRLITPVVPLCILVPVKMPWLYPFELKLYIVLHDQAKICLSGSKIIENTAHCISSCHIICALSDHASSAGLELLPWNLNILKKLKISWFLYLKLWVYCFSMWNK